LVDAVVEGTAGSTGAGAANPEVTRVSEEEKKEDENPATTVDILPSLSEKTNHAEDATTSTAKSSKGEDHTVDKIISPADRIMLARNDL